MTPPSGTIRRRHHFFVDLDDGQWPSSGHHRVLKKIENDNPAALQE